MDGITTSINSILKEVIQNFNTLLDCPVRFSGEYGGRNVRNFVDYIECYKKIKCITDEQALQELQHLLIDQAHIWWLQSKANLSQWSEALSSLEYQYSKQQPIHMIRNNLNAVIPSEAIVRDEPERELDQVMSILEKDQVDVKRGPCNSDIFNVMPILEKDQVDIERGPRYSDISDVMPILEKDQVDVKHGPRNSDITDVMPILEKDQVDVKRGPPNRDITDEMPILEKDQVDPNFYPIAVQGVENCSQKEQKEALTAKDFYIAGEIPQSVIDQLIPMINESRLRTPRRKRTNLLLQLPHIGRYRVVLRKSGRNAIKAIFPKDVNPFNDVDVNNDREEPRKEQQSQNHIMNAEENNENLHANEREPIIKVRRTEDLMPQIIDVEESATKQIKDELEQEEFISDHIKRTIKNTSHNSEENFQIDSDIMSQINNIINESEIHMETLDHNQDIPTILSGLPDSGSAIAYLYNGETTIQTEILTPKSPEPHSKTHSIIKKSNRCCFCRNKGHSYETCLKKAKKIKLIPDRVMTTANLKKSEFLKETEVNCVTSKNYDNDKTASTSKISLINTQSLLNNSPATFNSTNDISSLLYNIPEKCVNSLLTTKLIDPISGPSSNKVVAAKLRSTNVSMPKCHQCGTVGFYKSICPNCSPIYNNQNKQ